MFVATTIRVLANSNQFHQSNLSAKVCVIKYRRTQNSVSLVIPRIIMPMHTRANEARFTYIYIWTLKSNPDVGLSVNSFQQ
jgi:hypothetical protein